MTEPLIKKRLLTKVRRQFLHKTPDEDNEAQNHTHLLPTPEELDDGAPHLLEPGYGLVEKNRTIQAGWQFLNGSYKIESVTIERQHQCKAVTLNLKSNNINILPWEYCARRLESFGDLELATWAQRIKDFHAIYHQKYEEYARFISSNDTNAIMELRMGKVHSEAARRDIESKYVYLKFVIYASKESVTPVSLSYNEAFLKSIGYSTTDDFVDWIKENGIPSLFKGASDPSVEIGKMYLGGPKGKREICEEGPAFTTFIFDKEEKQYRTQIQLYFVKELRPEGFYISIYIVRKDLDINLIMSGQNDIGRDNNGREDNNECKFIKTDGDAEVRKGTSGGLEE